MYYSFIVPLFSTLHTHTVHINIGIDDLLPRDRKTVSNRVKRSKSKIRTFTLRLDYRLNIRLYRHSKIRRFFVKSFELYSVFILLPSWIVNYWQEERKVERTRPNWLFEFSNLALRCCLNVLANSWHSFGTHTRYLHRLFLLRPSYIDTVINDARADVIIGFSKTSYLTHFDKDASIIDVRYEPRVTRFLLPFLSLSFFVHHSVSDIKFFITYNKTFSIDYLCNSMIVPIRKRLSIPGSEYYSILLQFYYASFFFLLFNSLKS